VGEESAILRVTEFTDPGCVWSWSSEPTLRWLRRRYGAQIRWERVYGIQVDDLARTHPGKDPVCDAEAFRADWLAVAAHTGAPVTERLEWMHASTRPACAAALAAEDQGDAVAEPVLRRLREAVFVTGRPADTPERIADAVAGVAGLDVAALLERAASPAVAAALDDHWARTRDPLPDVIDRTGPGPNPGAAKADGEHLRYGFPTLVAEGPRGRRVLSGWRAPQAFAAELETLAGPALRPDARPWPVADALAHHRSLTAAELLVLTGVEDPGPDAVRIDTATAPLWLHPEEAAARGLPAVVGARR